MRTVLVLFLTVAVIGAVFGSRPASAKYASLVMDAKTGRVLHEINADTRNYPASLTKMMTLYMLFAAVEDGELSMNSHIRISRRAARQPASRLTIKAGRTITVRNAILALVTKSANDVATAVGEYLGNGSERKFALKMTAMARELGMGRTTFRNASGLPNRGQLSTARDMATLARALLRDFPGFYHFFATRTFSFGGLRHKNHNNLLKKYEGVDGIKTGYIRASGFNIVTSVERKGHRLIGVVFGGRTAKARDRHMVKLLDKGFGQVDPTLVASSKRKSKNGKRYVKGRWGIQVGAYNKYSPAYEMARKAVETAPDLLDDGVIKVVPLKRKRAKPVYRARILNISKKQAYRACKVLERRKVACMELRMKRPVQVASNAR